VVGVAEEVGLGEAGAGEVGVGVIGAGEPIFTLE